MSHIEKTLSEIAPKVTVCTELPGAYNPRHGLAIYYLPEGDDSDYVPPTAPGIVLGEALASHSGLSCTLLEGIPEHIPEGAVVLGLQGKMREKFPRIMRSIPELSTSGEYAIKLQDYALITAKTNEGICYAMQTLSMLILRHQDTVLPGILIADKPFCTYRGIAVELQNDEITTNLLLQIASFAATFKANHIQLILCADFDPSRNIPDISTFHEICRSYHLKVEIRLPWLTSVLNGERPLHKAWARMRSIAELFGAGAAAFDDNCPPNADAASARRLLHSAASGETGLKISVPVELFTVAGIPPTEGESMGIPSWTRISENTTRIPDDLDTTHIRIDIEGYLPGLSSRKPEEFHRRLNIVNEWLQNKTDREMFISFRNFGVSHLWQSLLYPAAEGLISAWGNSGNAESCAHSYANLLYGKSASSVIHMWDVLSQAFPPGLSYEDESLLRKIAFGLWPDSDNEKTLLEKIDWTNVITGMRDAALALRDTVNGLTRNTPTLIGAKMGLQALSWVHCFAALVPELTRRQTVDSNDGRTKAIAVELSNNFSLWYSQLESLRQSSGLEVTELPILEQMGSRIKRLCKDLI